MDWDTFFKDYGQSLFTLGGVFLGSLITFLINWLSLRTQSIERDKDRKEARRESKMQLALELTRTDIQVLDASIDELLRTMIIAAHASVNRFLGKVSDEAMREELDSQIAHRNSRMYQLGELNTNADKIAYSLGNEYYSEHRKLGELSIEYWNLVLNIAFDWNNRQEEQELYSKLISTASKLHQMLKEKLISIRDD